MVCDYPEGVQSAWCIAQEKNVEMLIAQNEQLHEIVKAAIAHACDCLLNAGDGQPCEHDRNWWKLRDEYMGIKK